MTEAASDGKANRSPENIGALLRRRRAVKELIRLISAAEENGTMPELHSRLDENDMDGFYAALGITPEDAERIYTDLGGRAEPSTEEAGSIEQAPEV